jgi:hypothetical protein
MSEINPTPEELVENIDMEVEDNTVVPMPIDPTLSNEGEAADAKATGDAIAAIAAVKKVLGQSPDGTGNVEINATQIPMSSEAGAQTISEAVLGVQAQTADTIYYVAGETDTVKSVVDGIITACTDGCTEDEIDEIFEDWEDEEA